MNNIGINRAEKLQASHTEKTLQNNYCKVKN